MSRSNQHFKPLDIPGHPCDGSREILHNSLSFKSSTNIYNARRGTGPFMLKPREQVSQKQIAAMAGVSQATVSLVLAGSNVTSAETRGGVLRAAERLRYRPNLLVQGIQTGKTRMIGVMAPPFDYYWSEVLYGIHDVLAAADHVAVMVWTAHHGPGPRQRDGPGMDELEQIHRLLDRRVDGVILWPSFASLFEEHVNEFSSRDLPVVTIDHELPSKYHADYVGSDEANGGRLVAEHLYKLGHRRFAHFAGSSAGTWAAPVVTHSKARSGNTTMFPASRSKARSAIRRRESCRRGRFSRRQNARRRCLPRPICLPRWSIAPRPR